LLRFIDKIFTNNTAKQLTKSALEAGKATVELAAADVGKSRKSNK